MVFGMGIDTGGTSTDAVIVDLESGEILSKSKSPTTPEDLCVGIRGAISFLDRALLKNISVVSLSSTLATNAVVEGKGCRVGLICVGFDAGKSDAEEYISIAGGHNVHGVAEKDLDTDSALKFMERIRGKVDSMAVSSFMSVRNPEHELRLKDMAAEILGIPVVCGHELSSKLGFKIRTATCVMNASLIPMMENLIDSVKTVMKESGISAPLMMVRGNGTIMGESMAREKPIETIMSGPTASMIGAVKLTGQKDAAVMDMGGTTTDIGIIRDGKPALTQEGMTVAGKKTHIPAAKVTAAGIGGDSRIFVNGGKISLRSTRAIPLCVAAIRWPAVLDILIKASSSDAKQDPRYPDDMVFLDTELFTAVGTPPETMYVSPEGREFLRMASECPISPAAAAQEIGTSPTLLGIRGLETRGFIQRVAFTPTDVLHADGTYSEFDRDASLMGARYLAKKCGKSVGAFISQCRDMIKAKLCTELMKVLLADQFGDRELDLYSSGLITRAALGRGDGFECTLRLKMPLVGIGAPASTYVRWVGDAFGAETYVDPDSDVGNALGAIASSIAETVEIIVSPADLDSPNSEFEVFTPEGKDVCIDLDEAMRVAERIGKIIAGNRAKESGACCIAYEVSSSDRFMGLRGMDILVERIVTVTAAGKPSMFGAENL